mmetsp:Transcript_29675/g.46789  ORF Transcript_29675/g.46789 Transcript_29675/m.46789 type:complete len:245 (-) Transcript_29675:1389-2123(-)
MLPLTSLSVESRPSSRPRRRTFCSPCSRSTSRRRASTAGRSARSTSESACACRLAGVTVKFTRVTREQRSGAKRAAGLRVVSTIRNLGEKSTSSDPRRMSVRPPVRWSSLFSTGLSTGSIVSTSCTSSGVPKRMALASVFMNPASRKEVSTSFRSLYFSLRKATACPEGSTTRGNRLNRSRMMAFSKQRSSLGSCMARQARRSAARLRYSAMPSPGRWGTPSACSVSRQPCSSVRRLRWSNTPA